MLFSNNFDEIVQKFMLGEDVYEIQTGTENINYYTAMKYTVVFSCVRVLAETHASVPVMLYRKKENGEREAKRDLVVYDILHNKPNDEMSPFNFKEACMVALNLGGNSVSEKLVNRKGELVGLYPYQWPQVDIKRDLETKKLVYKISSNVNGVTNDTTMTEIKTLKREQVFHVPGLSFNGVIGISPIHYATSAIRLGKSYEQFGVNFYKNGANSSGAFRHPSELGEEAFNRLKKDLGKNYTGLKNTGMPMLLEGGLEFQPFTINPADAQLIENKKFQIEDIARIYRVPLHLIQNLDKATNNNIEHQSLEFVMYTMLPWFKRWEENINMQLLTKSERQAGYYVEFKLDGLLRGDAKSRAESYAIGRQWGWLSVNDIRKLENLNPISNGDIYLQPMNMIEAGKAPDVVKAMTEELYKMITERREIA